MLAQRKRRIVKVHANHCGGLCSELPSRGRCNDRGRENESFERAKANPVRKFDQVKVAEDVALALIYAISEAVGEEGVVGKALDLLDEKPEGEIRGSVEGSGR